ncbi:sulfotransferase family 2 domain-containing protein [Kordiimonas sp.]|uniref:sulfotransferase family 2 domain-containing protein n=1 Tax=Kordiimonas sp. TaxID=1970157 RepID=UPI003A906167
MDTAKNTDINLLVQKAEVLLQEEAVDEAHALITSALGDYDHVRLWRFLRRILLMQGDEQAAQDLMARIIEHVKGPTPGELALAKSNRSAFTSLRDHKILYLHIPKCGSTTVKDMLYHVLTGERGEGHSHTLVSKHAPYAFEDRTRLGQTHADWFKFLVVRDPISRLRSYYRFNLVFTNDLSKEVEGRDTYLGLKLQPSYDEFLSNLTRYRQVFRTLRAHTNGIADIAGTDASIFDWIGPVKAMDSLRAHLSEKVGVDIPAIHNFRSKDMAKIEPSAALEEEARERYARDYEVYGAYF